MLKRTEAEEGERHSWWASGVISVNASAASDSPANVYVVHVYLADLGAHQPRLSSTPLTL